MAHAVIKPMKLVDRLVDPNHNIQSASVSNKIIEQIQHEKQLNFSTRKCELLLIGQVEDNCKSEANNMTSKQVEHVEYLGNFINLQGNNFDLIKSRVHRSYRSLTELISKRLILAQSRLRSCCCCTVPFICPGSYITMIPGPN